MLQVEIINTSGIRQRLCTWQCQLLYMKMLWNAEAFTATSSTTASCVTTPESFAAVALSFVIQYPAILKMQFNSKQLHLGLDQLAVRMANVMRERFGQVRVLLSIRGSTLNRRQVGEVLSWVRDFNSLDDYQAVIVENPSFVLRPMLLPQRRLLAEDENANDSPDEFIVDTVIVADQSDEANCCLVEGTVAAQQELTVSEVDFGMNVTSFDTPQVETVATVSRRSNSNNQTSSITPTRTEGGLPFPFWFVPIILVVLLILILICLFQTDGLYNTAEDENKESQEEETPEDF